VQGEEGCWEDSDRQYLLCIGDLENIVFIDWDVDG
jgi:hypothetical protein